MTSILATTKGRCFLCDKVGPTELHHIFNGPVRDRADKDGFTVYLCPDCHRTIHANAKKRNALKRYTQGKGMELYGWDMDYWMQRYFKNYL